MEISVVGTKWVQFLWTIKVVHRTAVIIFIQITSHEYSFVFWDFELVNECFHSPKLNDAPLVSIATRSIRFCVGVERMDDASISMLDFGVQNSLFGKCFKTKTK